MIVIVFEVKKTIVLVWDETEMTKIPMDGLVD